MNTQFEWWIEEEGESYEPPIEATSRPLRAMLCRACLVLLAVLAIALLTAWAGTRYRYRQAVARAAAEIQDMTDLEAQVVASCDRRRFLALQDPAAPHWVDDQAQRFGEHCLSYDAVPVQPYTTSLIGVPGRVQQVTLHDDLAWAQVIRAEGRERHVRFYRWTERGWLQAPPDPQFWGETVVWQHERLLVQGTTRDRPYGKALAAHIWDAAQAVCSTLSCSDDLELRVTFLPDATEQLPRISAQGLLLPSPWLTGIPADGGEVATDSLDRLTYWSAYYASAAANGLEPGSLNPTQKAVLAEYARFYTDGNLDNAPILRRVVDRQGVDVLPEVLRSLSNARTLSDLVAQWLSLPASTPDAYYAILLDIARDPATRACQETFDLLLRQEDEGWTAWMEASEEQYLGE
jgi:hypothetical protein